MAPGTRAPPVAEEVPAALPDGIWRTTFDTGQSAELTVAGGQPTAYRTDTPYVAQRVRRMDAATIGIDQARFRIASVSDSAITGTWTLGSYRSTVTFERG